MRDQISRFMQECPQAKSETFANNPFGAFVRNDIPESLYDTGLIDRGNYLVTASVGAGNWAMIPWICIFDRAITTSATKGVYIVYLLSKDSRRLYLTFNQGCTEIRNQHSKRETIQIMHQKAEEIRSTVSSRGFISACNIDLGDGLTELGEMYREGTIFYKQYDVEHVPDETELLDDLSRMMNIYADYAHKPDNDKWWPSLAEYDPGITKDQWLALLDDPNVFSVAWKSILAKFYDFGGTATCKQIEIHYGGRAASYNLTCSHIAKRVHQVTDCPLVSDSGGGYTYFTIMFFGREAAKGEEGTYVWKMRPELFQACADYEISRFLIKTGQFDSWTILDENTAIKKCDKSFYDYNGSGVPKGICWFFDADELDLGQVVHLKLTYHGTAYEGLVRNESSDRRRVRIFWNADLGRQLEAYRDAAESTATFNRLGDNSFEIVMKGDEEEMNVRDQVERIKAYIAAKGFSYADHLIENFYLALKSKPFVILAGTSGTGKTRLVRLFSEAIGAAYEQVPVRPDWSDSTDLFGHVDLNGRFVPGKILDFLQEARDNPQKPFVLCLDEMNLARVEYYLSDFLSVIETRNLIDGKIVSDPLVDEKDYGTDDKAHIKYGTIYFPQNLYIVGTVNMDETTFPFSRKVLDRANTIEFNYVDLNPSWLSTGEDVEALNVSNDFLASRFLQLAHCPDTERDYISGVCVELEKINHVLQKANAHVGYRVRDEIIFYLLNNKESTLLDESIAMDFEILQKILPRVQGSSASVKEMLCDLFKEIAGDYEGYQTDSNNTADRMLDILRKSDHVRYPKSAEKIAFMVRRFEEDGFTSYWL